MIFNSLMIKFTSIAALSFLFHTIPCHEISFAAQNQESLLVSHANNKNLRIGTWNLKRLGNGSKRYDLVAKVIEENMDIVSLQEVMSPQGLQKLLEQLPGWSAVLSSKVGRNGYFEYYAVATRTEKITFVSNSVVRDEFDYWAREPMVTCMKASKVDFCMITTHIVYGDSVLERDDEISRLSLILDKLVAETSEKDFIVVGDFNRETSAKVFNKFTNLGFQIADNKEKTTLGQLDYSNSYDHIILNLSSEFWSYPAKRIDITNVVCRRNFKWCATNVSDHAPVVLSLNDI